MKAVIWLVFALLMALWTGFSALLAGLVQWLLSAASGGHITEAAQALGQFPVPAWVGIWVDTAWVQSIQVTGLAVVQWLGHLLPSAGVLTDWVVPLVWVVWGVASLGLLAAAVIGHMLAGRVGASKRFTARTA